MDYEKKYNEALERAEEWITEREQLICPREIVESIFPELRESEDKDEKIRKEIINYLDFAETHNLLRAADYKKKKGWIDWLEKQEDAFENGRQFGIMQEQARQELEWDEQKEQKPTDLLDTMLSKDPHLPKQAVKYEQKPAEWNYDNRIQYDSIKSGIEAFASTYSFNIESKLFPQLTKEQQQLWREEIEQAVIAGGESGIELARDNRYKENKTAECLKAERDGWYVCIKDFYAGGKKQCSVGDLVQAKGGMYMMGKEDISEWFRRAYYEEVRDAFEPNTDANIPEKPAEWSEEDEKIRNLAIEWAETMSGQCNFVGMDSTDFRKIATWLKSLRPSWKPSEEQMEAFRGYIEDFQARAEAAVGGWNNFDVMIHLYEQLKQFRP